FEIGLTYMLQMLHRDKEALLNSENVLRKLESLHQNAQRDSILLAFHSEAILARADMAQQMEGSSAAQPYCKQVSDMLAGIPNIENNFNLLSFQVRADLCQGTANYLSAKLARLQAMGFREAKFMKYISTHPLMKGKQ